MMKINASMTRYQTANDNRLCWQIEGSDMLIDACVKDSLFNGLCCGEYRLIDKAIDNYIHVYREIGR